jgi:hypothetical protein
MTELIQTTFAIIIGVVGAIFGLFIMLWPLWVSLAALRLLGWI